MSREHDFAWKLSEALNVNRDGTADHHHLITHSSPSDERSIHVTSGAHGQLFSTTSRNVCRTCNNGWMSGIENEFLELTSRVKSIPLESSFALNRDEVIAARRWAALTALKDFSRHVYPDMPGKGNEVVTEKYRRILLRFGGSRGEWIPLKIYVGRTHPHPQTPPLHLSYMFGLHYVPWSVDDEPDARRLTGCFKSLCTLNVSVWTFAVSLNANLPRTMAHFPDGRTVETRWDELPSDPQNVYLGGPALPYEARQRAAFAEHENEGYKVNYVGDRESEALKQVAIEKYKVDRARRAGESTN